MIHFLPIEPLWQRYSEQWLIWFEREFYKNGIQSKTWMGQQVGDLNIGQFLDVYGTHIFKFTQLTALISETQQGRGLKDGDTVFLMDMWFPGLEALAYLRQGAGIDFKIMGILHDGTYNPADFLAQRGMGTWGEPLENSWFELMDKVFVATDFHRDFLLSKRQCHPDKVVVTGLPFYAKEVDACIYIPRKWHLAFPHRIAPEKAPEKFDQLLRVTGLKGWRRQVGEPALDKLTYYRKLAQSEIAISYATQEMFGIAMLEACANGCLPLVPNRLAYSEMYPGVFKYEEGGEDYLPLRVKVMLGKRKELEPIARKIAQPYAASIDRIISYFGL